MILIVIMVMMMVVIEAEAGIYITITKRRGGTGRRDQVTRKRGWEEEGFEGKR